MTSAITVEIQRLPHAEGLALPAYQSTYAAGLDLLAAVPEDKPLTMQPGQRALVPTGLMIAVQPGHAGSGAMRPVRWLHANKPMKTAVQPNQRNPSSGVSAEAASPICPHTAVSRAVRR